MHPSVDEQLEGIARLLERSAERHPDDPSIDRLRTAAGTLRRIAGAWADILPCLTRDNDEMKRLFQRYEDELPDTVRATLQALDAQAVDPLSAKAVEARNGELREALAEWIQRLPPDADIARAAIVTHCRERIARDPFSAGRRSPDQREETRL